MRYLLLIAEEPPTGQPSEAEIVATMGDYNAFGSWLALASRGGSDPSAAATSERPATTEAPVPTEGSPAPAPPAAAPASPVADSGAPASAPAPAPAPSADVATTARAADFAAAKLDDSQLVVLFALEGRKTLPSCAEPHGGKRPPNDARRARQQLESAQKKLAAGDALAAYGLACGAAATTPSAAAAQIVAAQRLIAELALELGDTAQAKAAVDKALARAPKDKALIALRGDVLALMGDIGASRAAWLRAAPGRGSMATRTKKLAQSSKKLGDKALAASQHGQAAAYYRRAVILTRGAYVQSFGLSEALLGMGRTQAALLWAERATQALPKDSRWRVLFGDALYQSGQSDRARNAWKAALDAQPGNRVAARRVREGKPE